MDLIKRKFAILEEISSAIVVSDSVEAIANLMLDLALEYTNAETGSLMLINESGELFILAARGTDSQLMSSFSEKIGEGIAGVVAKNRTPLLVRDIDNDRRFKSKKRNHYKTKSFISCPVICRKRLLGVFNINDKKTGEPFAEDEFALLKIIANQAAIILENAFLNSRLQSKAAELEEVIKKPLDSGLSEPEVLTQISHELRTPLNSIKGAIYYLGQSKHVARAKRQEFFEIIAHETEDLGNSVENLLNILRLEDEKRHGKKFVADIPSPVNNKMPPAGPLKIPPMKKDS
ncbi:MAG: GAF domain-containing protein [Thermodesulfovibrionales bacterium]